MNPKPWRMFLTTGLVSAVGLFGFYWLLTALLSRDTSHPFQQFALLQPWISLLIAGFGIQVGLVRLLHRGFRTSATQRQDTRRSTGAAATVSGTSMIACCAHHLADLIPILSTSGIAVFLVQYQRQFVILGVLLNGLGVLYMLRLLGWPALTSLMAGRNREETLRL